MKTIAALCFLFVITACFQIVVVNAQSSQQGFTNMLALPNVFKLGEHSQQYEKLMPGYQSLLEACDGDMKSAHAKLFSMMKEMEEFGDMVDFDLDGIKAWLHFFFNEDGSVQHIGFHLKPNSRNVDTVEFSTFLKNFSKQYKFPLRSDTQYAHYSTFSFPVF